MKFDDLSKCGIGCAIEVYRELKQGRDKEFDPTAAINLTCPWKTN